MARLVIVGGGIVGSAAAYHLAVIHGWDDIVVIDQGPLPYNAGSTSHAPGGVVAASHNKTLTRMALYSADLYESLDAYDDQHVHVNRLGGLEIARTPQRFEDLKRLHGEGKSYGYTSRLLTPAETVELVPWFDPAAFAGSFYVEESQLVKGYHLVGDFMRKAEATGRVTFHAHTGLGAIETAGGAVTGVTTTNPELERIDCEQVLLAANVWSPAIADQLGVSVPLTPFEHQYAITTALDDWAEWADGTIHEENRYPLIRDVDVTMYYRSHHHRLGIGSYHHAPRAVPSDEMGDSALRPFTPADFTEAWKLAQEIVPMLRGREPEFDDAYNGIFAFSADAMPIIGPSSVVHGLWSANASWLTHGAGVAKSVAEWMADGHTEWDMRECHLHRFGAHVQTRAYLEAVSVTNYTEIYDVHHPKEPLSHPRNVRLTPFHQRHLDADCVFTPFAGLELPNWFASNEPLLERYGDAIPDRDWWGAMHWSPIMGAEHLATRDTASLWDLSGLSIIEVAGPRALEYVDRLCTNRVDGPVGSVVYTLWLTPEGGIKRDLTVARRADDVFWMFVGEGTLPQDLDWVRRHVGDGAVVSDRSGAYSGIGIFGPSAPAILGAVADADLAEFRFYSGRTLDVGMAKTFAMRISYVGENGWELHVPMESSLPVWDALWEAGREHGMVRAGLGAMDSMRLEKGYRLWGADIHTEYNPYEAGLGWTVRVDKGDFIGRDAARAAKEAPPERTLSCLILDGGGATLMGYEPVLADGQTVGHITTGNMGYTVGRYIAYAYLPTRLAVPGTELTVEYFDEPYRATVTAEPLFDPKMERMRR